MQNEDPVDDVQTVLLAAFLLAEEGHWKILLELGVYLSSLGSIASTPKDEATLRRAESHASKSLIRIREEVRRCKQS